MGAVTGQGAAARGARGEKRQLAILFADLADSTRLCAAMGAEEFHALVFDFLRDAAAAVEANGGYVARFMGDGLLAYFGYPAAAEDDSVRAIRAALAIRSAVAGPNAPAALAVRTGIATGAVVLGPWIGDGAARERPVVGDAANLAARLQSAAAPDTILVAEPTFRLAQTAFRFNEHPGLVLKGIDSPTRAYEVIAAAGWNHRPWAEAPRRPIVGRAAELDPLYRDFAAARNGDLRLVGIVGEAGIGKSTLVAAFLDGLAGRAFRPAVAAANPGFTNTPFFMARQFFADDPFVVGTDADAGDPGTIVDLAVDRLLAREGDGPLLVVAEDLHWADPSSRAFLARLVERAPPALMICTSRDAIPALSRETNLRPVTLPRLPEADMRELVRRESTASLSTGMIAKIIERADGVPLFGVELARHLDETNGVDDATLPWTLSELLAARLSNLRGSLRLAQSIAVLGVSGELDLLADLAGMTRIEAEDAASALQATGAVRLETMSDGPVVIFHHALVRDALYDTLFALDRKALHRRAAEKLEARAPGSVSLDDLARHWAAGDDPARAAAAYARAGEDHRRHCGFHEAERAIDLGLAALRQVRASPARDKIELDLQSSLASVLQISRGYSTERAVTAANRARTLAERQGELTHRFASLAGQWMAASSGGDYPAAAKAAQQLLSIANSVGNREQLAAAWMAQLTSRFRMGDIVGAEQAFLAGESHFSAASFAERPGAIAQTYGNAALVAVLLGNPAARSRAAFAIRHARRAGSDYDICFAVYMTAMLCLMLGAERMARRWSERALRLATRIGFPQFTSIAQVVLGRAMAGLGEAAEGVETIRSGIEAMDATNARVGLTLYLSWLAEAECFANEADRAARTLERALTVNPAERFYLPETLRLKARLLSVPSAQREAGDLKREAIALATAMGGEWFLRRLTIDDGDSGPSSRR